MGPRRAVVAAALLALLPFAPLRAQTPTPTAAPEPTGITLAPEPGSPSVSRSGTHFEFGRVLPGTRPRGLLVARNLGTETQRATLYGADAIPARGGGFGFTMREETPRDLGAWLRLDRTTVTLAGRQTTTIGFTVDVPTDATAGEHIGGVVLEPVDAASGGGFEVGTRLAVGVYLTVGGSTAAPRPQLTVTRLRTPVRDRQVCPSIAYTNTGTTVLDPTAEIVVDPGLPGRTQRYPAGKVGGVAPGGSVDVELPCVRKAPIGRSKVTVRLAFPGGGAERSATASYWPFSVFAAGILLLLLLLALLWLLLAARRRSRREEDEEDHSTSPGVASGNDHNGP